MKIKKIEFLLERILIHKNIKGAIVKKEIMNDIKKILKIINFQNYIQYSL